jgi:hypothetical protein
MSVPRDKRDACPQCGAKTSPIEGVFIGPRSSAKPWEFLGVCPKCSARLQREPDDHWRLASRAA